MMIDFAITTDYVTARGSPLPYLKSIAKAGWKWIHWCHHWKDDHLYQPDELAEIERWLGDLNLRVLDIHGTTGRHTRWDSLDDGRRRAGVELVRNRIEMAARLHCDVLIMHPSNKPRFWQSSEKLWTALCRSIDELLPDLRRHNVRLAIENLEHENFDQIDRLMPLYPPDLVGICYDPGHGNIAGNGLDRMTQHFDRLIALHLNDNDGRRDLHQPPFMGTVDWPRLGVMIRQSNYRRPAMSVEVVMKHSGMADEQMFLKQTLAAVHRFGQMLDG